MPRYKRIMSLKERFEMKIHKTDSCWFWSAYTNRDGYGVIGIEHNKTDLAHRVSWILHYGEIPFKSHVLHKCDTPSCVRPDHLFLGTPLDNSLDRESKCRGGGTKRTGSKNGRSVLTESQVINIRNAHQQHGASMKQLAKTYGVSPATIWFIVRRKTWLDVHG